MSSLIRQAMEGQFEAKAPMISLEEEQLLEEQTEATSVEIVKDVEDAEEALRVVSALEDLAIVAQTIETVTPREAALIQIASDNIMHGTDVNPDVVTPAMEDMTGGSGESIAARLKEVIKRIVAAIKELLINLGKKLKDFIAASDRLGKQKLARTEELLKKIDKLDGKPSATTVKVNNGFFLRESNYTLADQKPITKPSEVIQALKSHLKMVQVYKTHSVKTIGDISQAAVNFFFAARQNSVKNVSAEQALEYMRKAGFTLFSSNFSWMSEIAKVDSTREMFGKNAVKYETEVTLMGVQLKGKRASSTKIQEAKTPAELAQAFSEAFRDTDLFSSFSAGDPVPVTMPVYSPSDLKAMLSVVEDIAKECVESSDTLAEVYKEQTERIEGAMRNIEKSIDVNDFGGDITVFLSYVNVAQSVLSALARMTHDAYADLVASSLKIVDRGNAIALACIQAQGGGADKDE